MPITQIVEFQQTRSVKNVGGGRLEGRAKILFSILGSINPGSEQPTSVLIIVSSL